MPHVSTDNSNKIDIGREENDNDVVTQVTHTFIMNEPEYEGICYSDDGEDDELNTCNTINLRITIHLIFLQHVVHQVMHQLLLMHRILNLPY